MKQKATQLAVVRHILAMERHSRKNAKECSSAFDKFKRTQMVSAYNADAEEYKELAALVRAKEYIKAFKYWRGLDTFVREGVYGKYADFLATQAIKEHTKRTRRG